MRSYDRSFTCPGSSDIGMHWKELRMPLKELRNGLRMPWAMSFTFSGALWNLSIGSALGEPRVRRC